MEKSKKTKIQKVPKKRRVKIQAPAEQRERIKGWIELLKELPHCDMGKTPNKTESMHVRDNPERFADSLIVWRIEYNFDHPEVYILMYCCFLKDGKFRIESEYPDWHIGIIKNDPGGWSLLDHENATAKTWTQGYMLMIKMINRAFKMSIPEPPQTK